MDSLVQRFVDHGVIPPLENDDENSDGEDEY